MHGEVATVPGTSFPFPVITGGKRPGGLSPAEARQRRGLLAKVHIAKAQMGLNDGEYEMILRSFRVDSSAHMTIPQLEHMVRLLKYYGWKPSRRHRTVKGDPLPALRRRCVEEAAQIPNGEKRLAGLAQKICGTAQLAWCRDANKLERLLAVLGKIKEKEIGP